MASSPGLVCVAWEPSSGQEESGSASEAPLRVLKRKRGRPRKAGHAEGPARQSPCKLAAEVARQHKKRKRDDAEVELFLQPSQFGQLLRPSANTLETSIVHAVSRERIRKTLATDTLLEACLGDVPRMAMPVSAEARMHHQSRTHFLDKVCDVAAAVHVASKAFASSFCSHLCHSIREGRAKPICAFTMVQYDETPMVARHDTFQETVQQEQQQELQQQQQQQQQQLQQPPCYDVVAHTQSDLNTETSPKQVWKFSRKSFCSACWCKWWAHRLTVVLLSLYLLLSQWRIRAPPKSSRRLCAPMNL